MLQKNIRYKYEDRITIGLIASQVFRYIYFWPLAHILLLVYVASLIFVVLISYAEFQQNLLFDALLLFFYIAFSLLCGVVFFLIYIGLLFPITIVVGLKRIGEVSPTVITDDDVYTSVGKLELKLKYNEINSVKVLGHAVAIIQKGLKGKMILFYEKDRDKREEVVEFLRSKVAETKSE